MNDERVGIFYKFFTVTNTGLKSFQREDGSTR